MPLPVGATCPPKAAGAAATTPRRTARPPSATRHRRGPGPGRRRAVVIGLVGEPRPPMLPPGSAQHRPELALDRPDAPGPQLPHLPVGERPVQRTEPEAESETPSARGHAGAPVDVEEGNRLQQLAPGHAEHAG